MKTKHFDTPFHTVAVTTAKDGRISVVIGKGKYPMQSTIIDVEIPSQEGEHKHAFTPTVKIAHGILMEYFE